MGDQVYPKNTLNVATVENDGVVAIAQQTTMEYMNSLNYLPNTKKKWSMRGGHFFLYRYIVYYRS
jgi:hypothetical protein